VLERLSREVSTIDLDLKEVTFLDSAGIGVLVRTLLRTRIAGKQIRITALSPQVRNTLEITNVLSQFAYTGDVRNEVRAGLRVLFVHPSAEVRTFVDALLRQRGAHTETCASLYDARQLAATTERFDVVVVPAEIDTTGFSPQGSTVLKLEDDFFSASAETAGESLIARLNAARAI
jgi:hypothetical protein